MKKRFKSTRKYWNRIFVFPMLIIITLSIVLAQGPNTLSSIAYFMDDLCDAPVGIKIQMLTISIIFLFLCLFGGTYITFNEKNIQGNRSYIDYSYINYLKIKTKPNKILLIINYSPIPKCKFSINWKINPTNFNTTIEELLQYFPTNIPIIEDKD